MNFWEKVEKDLQKEIKAGIAFLKESTSVIRKKAEELSEEGKRRQAVIQLKTNVRNEMAELGGRVYALIGTKDFPVKDKKVKAVAARIKKLEAQLTKLEGKGKTKAKTKKAAVKRTVKTRKA